MHGTLSDPPAKCKPSLPYLPYITHQTVGKLLLHARCLTYFLHASSAFVDVEAVFARFCVVF